MAVNINRDIPLASNIETNPSSFYSAKGGAPFADYLETGVFKPKTDGIYKDLYFNKGVPLDRYAGGGRIAGDVIVESNSPNIGKLPNGYYGTPQLTNKDPYTIYKKAGTGYEKFYQNVPSNVIRSGGMIPTAIEAISPYIPQAIKSGVSALGNIASKVALPAMIGQAAWNANADERARNEYQSRMQDFANIPKDTEIRSGR